MPARHADYDPFARIYNLHWGTRSDRHLDLIDRHVLQGLASGARVLDLCCGTGQLAHTLAERGYSVLGIDGSEGMLAFAQTNAPTARFLLADARHFEVQEPFDVVLCLFDSLNHLMTENDLAKAFDSTARALHPGGLFAFDLNMEVKYLQTWSGEFSVIGDEEVAIVRTSVDPEAKRGMFDATLFYEQGDDRWSREEVHLMQTWYSEETVGRLLAKAGFETPTTYVKQPLPSDPTVAQNLLFVTARVR